MEYVPTWTGKCNNILNGLHLILLNRVPLVSADTGSSASVKKDRKEFMKSTN